MIAMKSAAAPKIREFSQEPLSNQASADLVTGRTKTRDRQVGVDLPDGSAYGGGHAGRIPGTAQKERHGLHLANRMREVGVEAWFRGFGGLVLFHRA